MIATTTIIINNVRFFFFFGIDDKVFFFFAHHNPRFTRFIHKVSVYARDGYVREILTFARPTAKKLFAGENNRNTWPPTAMFVLSNF